MATESEAHLDEATRRYVVRRVIPAYIFVVLLAVAGFWQVDHTNTLESKRLAREAAAVERDVRTLCAAQQYTFSQDTVILTQVAFMLPPGDARTTILAIRDTRPSIQCE